MSPILIRVGKGSSWETDVSEYEIKFSKVRQARGLPGYAVMRLEAHDEQGEFWKAVSEHRSEADALAALNELKAKDGE